MPRPFTHPVALVGLALGVVLAAFTARIDEEPALPATPFDYDGITLPPHLTAPPVADLDNTPAGNATTDLGATLGRVLFYDTRLSLNQTVSCASCHHQASAFADPARFSTGFEGGQTTRNAMGLTFARFYQSGHFFWDERAATLEVQTLMPIQNAVEMGMTLPGVVARLQSTAFYGGLFQDAFGTPDITSDRVSRALSQFVRSIVGPGARYDQGRGASPPGPPGQPLPNLTAQENQGLGLFFGRARCVTCHRGDLFVGDIPRNNGLDATTTDPGAGNGRFKAPSLRNVALTAPYMHDGRFPTLTQVIAHYDTGVQNHPNLDPLLRSPGGQPLRLNLTAAERAALIAFLGTLTDAGVTTDPRWSDPFGTATATGPDGADAAVALDAPAPNPITGSASLTFRLAEAGAVEVAVFDALGRRVATLVEGAQGAGAHTLRWDAVGLPAGRYVVRLAAAGAIVARTVTLVR